MGKELFQGQSLKQAPFSCKEPDTLKGDWSTEDMQVEM